MRQVGRPPLRCRILFLLSVCAILTQQNWTDFTASLFVNVQWNPDAEEFVVDEGFEPVNIEADIDPQGELMCELPEITGITIYAWRYVLSVSPSNTKEEAGETALILRSFHSNAISICSHSQRHSFLFSSPE